MKKNKENFTPKLYKFLKKETPGFWNGSAFRISKKAEFLSEKGALHKARRKTALYRSGWIDDLHIQGTRGQYCPRGIEPGTGHLDRTLRTVGNGYDRDQ